MALQYERDPSWTHSGGVVWRGGRRAPEILLVRAKPTPHDWVLPKGHLERGEMPHECARREVREEAGVDADPIAFVGDDTFTTPAGKRVHAAFFVLKFVDLVQADEEREVRWCSLPEALALLRFEGARRIIRAAANIWSDGSYHIEG
jgi:8-oxo-dGTP pyrophosphatase MutT (NUDIX family)